MQIERKGLYKGVPFVINQGGKEHMAFVTLRQLLDHAAERGYGVPAFNVNNLEQIRAIFEAADATDGPSSYRHQLGQENMQALRLLNA